MTYHPAITASGYKLLARALGTALHQAGGDGLYDHLRMIDCIISELRADNAAFDEQRFRRSIEAIRQSEGESVED